MCGTECEGGRAPVRQNCRPAHVGGAVDRHQAVLCAACWRGHRSHEVGVQALHPFLSTARRGPRDGFGDPLLARAPAAIFQTSRHFDVNLTRSFT